MDGGAWINKLWESSERQRIMDESEKHRLKIYFHKVDAQTHKQMSFQSLYIVRYIW